MTNNNYKYLLPDNKDLEIIILSSWMAYLIKNCKLLLTSAGILFKISSE